MSKQFLTARQAISMITMFILGSSVVMGGYSELGQDSWVALLGALVLAVPAIVVYARIMQLFPEKNLFEIILTLFGKFFGKFLVALFTWYSIHLAALVIRNFSEFITIVTMPDTPELASMMLMLFVSVYMAKSGSKTPGRSPIITLPIIIII